MKDILQRIGFVAGLGIAALVNGCTTKTETAKWYRYENCESGGQTYLGKTLREQPVRMDYIAGIHISGEMLWPVKKTIYRCGSGIVEREEVVFEDGSRRIVFQKRDGTY